MQIELTKQDYIDNKELAKKDDAMGRCIRECMDKGETHERAVEICWYKLNGKTGEGESMNFQEPVAPAPTGTEPAKPTPPKTKVDMLAEIKKLLQKNNMTIDDNTLLALVNKIQILGMSMKAIIDGYESESLELQMINPAEEEQEILALPKGRKYVVTKTFQGWVDFNDKLFKDIIKNYNNIELSKPYIDREHDRRESYGDILGFRISKEGLFAKIKLNSLGINLVKENAYKYISPTITNHKDTKGNDISNWLATISLVNSPALLGAMPALQEQLKLKIQEIRGAKKTMNLQTDFNKIQEYAIKLNHPLTLQGEIDPEAAAKILPEIAKMLEEVMAKITELTGQKEAAEGEAKTNKEAANVANQQVAAMKQEKLEAEKEGVIKEAVELGCYIPNEEFLNMKREDFIKNPDGIKKEISLWKKANPSAQRTQMTGINHSATFDLKLTAEEIEIAKDSHFDISTPEKIKEFKQVIGGK